MNGRVCIDKDAVDANIVHQLHLCHRLGIAVVSHSYSIINSGARDLTQSRCVGWIWCIW